MNPSHQITGSTAVIDPTSIYRYSLGRCWEHRGEGQVTFIMLNPSTADASINDPTITRCINYAQRWGYERLEVVNLFALRATDPNDLWKHPAPVGPDNDRFISEAIDRSGLVICGWGVLKTTLAHMRAWDVEQKIKTQFQALHALKITRDGYPWHPLYLSTKLNPINFLGTP